MRTIGRTNIEFT